MQLAQTYINLFLTPIKPAKLIQDGHTRLKKCVDIFKTDKINSEWTQSDQNMLSATVKVFELLSYTHRTGETHTGWTQTAERMT